MEFNEKELRKEISYAIKNIHGIRHVSVLQCYELYITHLIINACESVCAHLMRSEAQEDDAFVIRSVTVRLFTLSSLFWASATNMRIIAICDPAAQKQS